MKRIKFYVGIGFLLIISVLLFADNKQIGTFKRVNISEKLHSGKYDLISVSDSAGQYKFENMADPAADLDGVNLRTLRYWTENVFDTIVVGLDTFISLPPDTFLNNGIWLHSGQEITHPETIDTFYVQWMAQWVEGGEQITTPKSDSVLVEWMNTYISNGETITTPPDSFFVPEENIWVTKNQPITRGDSTFYVQQKPNCPNCWQYSYDNSYWVNWFCSETGASNLSIDYNADEILGIHYNSGLGAYTDSLYFRILEADSGKVPMIIGDEVVWRAIPKDSLFDAYSSDWLLSGDTIKKQMDSIQINNEWVGFGESVVTDSSLWKILDSTTIASKTKGVNIGYETHVDEGLLVWTSGNSITAWSGTIGVTSSADSIAVESIGQKIGTYSRSTNGIGVKAYSHAGIAIDALSDDSTAINVVSGGIGINSYSQDGIAINASSANESAIVGESFYKNGVKGLNITGGIGVLGDSENATGVKGTTQRGVGVYAEVTIQDGLPLVAQSTVYSPLVADFRGSQGIASNKLYLGGGTHEEKGAQLYIDGAQEIYGSSLENYGLLIRDSKGIYCDSTLRLGGYLSGGVTYPSAPGRTGQFLRLRDSLSGVLEFVDPDSSLWYISGTGIRSKIDNVGIGIDSDGHYGLSVQGIDYYPSLGLWQSGTGDFLQGRKGSSVIWNIDNDGLATFPSLTVGSGATITRSGTIASKDICTGTAAEFAANTVKDGITPQASTTIAFILD